MSEKRDHQFGLNVLGVHICSFWAASYHRPEQDQGSVWFANAAGHTVMALSLHSGVTVTERQHDDYTKDGEWRVLIDGRTLNSSEPHPVLEVHDGER